MVEWRGNYFKNILMILGWGKQWLGFRSRIARHTEMADRTEQKKEEIRGISVNGYVNFIQVWACIFRKNLKPTREFEYSFIWAVKISVKSRPSFNFFFKKFEPCYM